MRLDALPETADKEIIVFVFPETPTRPGELPTNIVVARQPMRDDDDLKMHVDRRLIELASKLDRFELAEGQRETSVGGRRAIRVRVTSLCRLSTVEQTMVFVDPPDRTQGVPTFALTSPGAPHPAAAREFQKMVDSVRFDDVESVRAHDEAPASQRPVRVSPLPKAPPSYPMPGVGHRGALGR